MIKLFKNSVLSSFGLSLPLIAAFLTTPRVMSLLGNREFGLLTMSWALLGYFGIFDFGVGRALTVLLGVWRGKSTDKELYGPDLASGLLLSLISGVLAMGLAWFFLRWFFHIKGPFSGATTWSDAEVEAMQLCIWGIFPMVMTNTMRGALEGLDRFKESSAIRGITGAVIFLAPFAISFVYPLTLKLACLSIVMFRWLGFFGTVYCLRAELSFCSWRQIHRGSLKKIFSFGSWVTVSTLISSIMNYGDRFLLSMWLGPESLPQYAVPQEIVQRCLILPFSFGFALLPVVAGSSTSWPQESGDASTRYKFFKTQLLIAVIMMAFVSFVIWFGAKNFISWWISPEFATQTHTIFYILSIGIFANGVAQVPYTFLHGLGAAKITGIIHIIEVPIYFASLKVLVGDFGVVGAAWAWAVRAIMDLVLLSLALRRAWHKLL